MEYDSQREKRAGLRRDLSLKERDVERDRVRKQWTKHSKGWRRRNEKERES